VENASSGKLLAAFDPRRRIYRDSFNEYFVFILSATGAAVVVPMLMLLAGAIVGHFGVVTFLAASAALELFLIFGIGRPQMTALERVGWALLWGASALIFGVCFYYLVFETFI
jgi:hypothetical protein